MLLNNVTYSFHGTAGSTSSVRLPAQEEGRIGSHRLLDVLDKDAHTEAEFSACSNFLSLIYSGSMNQRLKPNIKIYRLNIQATGSTIPVDPPANLDLSTLTYITTTWHPVSPIFGMVTWSKSLRPAPEDGFEVSCYLWDLENSEARESRWVKVEKTYSDPQTSINPLQSY